MLKEFNSLIDRGTFEYQKHTNKKLVLLIWVYANKFDEDGFLTNFKAKLVTRGDLYKTEEETYTTTLAAQTFRAIAALIAAFDLETRQYNTIMEFVNTKFKKPILMQCPAGFTKPGFYLLALRALYGFTFSPLL
jgi:F0F1-type ATP synthase delta subunit